MPQSNLQSHRKFFDTPQSHGAGSLQLQAARKGIAHLATMHPALLDAPQALRPSRQPLTDDARQLLPDVAREAHAAPVYANVPAPVD